MPKIYCFYWTLMIAVSALVPEIAINSNRNKHVDSVDNDILIEPEDRWDLNFKEANRKWDHKHKALVHSKTNQSTLKSPSLWTRNTNNVFSTTSTTSPPLLASNLEANGCDVVDGVCPPYRLLERTEHYDIRWYPSYKWASTIITSQDRFLSQWQGLSRLENFFSGQNDQGLFMNATLPLLSQIKHSRHPGVLRELRDITFSLPIPPSHQSNPPLPLTGDILVDDVEDSRIFVQSFRARLWELTDKSLRNRARELISTLRLRGEAFYDRYFYLASYSRPGNTDDNVYEMWIHATRQRNPQRNPHRRITNIKSPLNKITNRTRKRLCRGVECPSFQVLRSYKFGIQKRRYFDTVFVSAASDECEFNSVSIWRGFMPLHLYKHGINSHWEVCETTRPIGIVNIRDTLLSDDESVAGQKSFSPSCPTNMTVAFYLPRRLHSNPPSASIGAPTVKITRVNHLIVYVQTVGGFILDAARSTVEVRKFANRLQQLGLCYKKDEYYLVTYDFLVRFHGRQNEIWLVADRCPVRMKRPT